MSVAEVTFEDGSRWEGIDIALSPGVTPEEAVENAIQSLIDHGEFEECFSRTDEPSE